MKADLQRIAIAESVGWTEICDMLVGIMPTSENMANIPEYNLDEMHEVEKTIWKDDALWSEYCKVLNDICCPIQCGGNNQHCGYSITATADQRAEAYLRTIGAWIQEDGE